MLQKLYRICLISGLASLLGPGAIPAQTIYQTIGSLHTGPYPQALTTPVHVVLPEPMSEPKLSETYKKPAARADYLAEVAAKRVALAAAAKHWHLSPMSIITAEEARIFETDKQQVHLLLDMGTIPIEKYSENVRTGRGGTRVYPCPALRLYLVGNLGESKFLGQKTVYTSSLLYHQLYYPFNGQTWPQIYPTTEVVAAVQQLQAYMAQCAQNQSPRDIKKAAEESLGKSGALLPSKTLLISREQLVDGAPEGKLAQLYPYPILVTDQPTLDAAVATADSRYVYIRYVTIESDNGYQLLDASTGKVLGYSIFHATSSHDIGHVQAADLKQLVKTATKP